MLEWMVAALVVVILIAKILEVFDVIDPSEVILGALKLTAGLLFAVGAFCVYVTRRSQEKRQ